MDTIRILVIDDHQVVREGLRRMIELEPDLKVVGEAGTAKEALNQVQTLSPEVILMDIKMPEVDGVTLTKQIKQKYPDANIIMLTLYDEYLSQAIEAGAKGYLLKDIHRDELVRAIRAVHEGRSPFNLSLSPERLADFVASPDGKSQTQLTDRELTMLRLVANGATTEELAGQMFLSEASVKRGIHLIFEKLNVRNRSEAVSEAYKRKLL
jgi:two-component system, NarL family, response regulator LiaR